MREVAEGELVKECEISAEKRVGDLTQECQEQRATAERYKGEVARLEALLAEKDLALNQSQPDLSAAQGEVVRWHRSSAENEKRAEGKNFKFFTLALFVFGLVFLTFMLFSFCFSTELEKKVA